MACYDNTCRSAPAKQRSRNATAIVLQTSSTHGPARDSATAHRRNASMGSNEWCASNLKSHMASMGPRSHERGNDSRLTLTRHLPTCFNGAAFSRTRKPHRHRVGTARCAHSFNGAAFSRTRKRLNYAIGPSSALGFNGAAFSRTRKHTGEMGRPAHGAFASMGPRSHERGNGMCPRAQQLGAVRFNGAAFSRTRKPRRSPSSAGSWYRFNGAAFSRTRKRWTSNRTLRVCRCFNGAAFSRTRKPGGRIAQVNRFD